MRSFIEIMGHTGFDFAVLDPEQDPDTVQMPQDMIRTAAAADLFPIVRLKAHTRRYSRD